MIQAIGQCWQPESYGDKRLRQSNVGEAMIFPIKNLHLGDVPLLPLWLPDGYC